MQRVYFEESQYLRQTRWIWFIIIPSSLIALIPLLYWLQDANRTDGLVASLLTLVGTGLVLAILLAIKLDTRVDDEGVHYRFFPNKPKWNHIRKEDMAEFELRKKRNFLSHGIVGYHRNVFQKTQAMTISGHDHLWIRLRNNQKLLLGTQRPTELQRAIKRLLSTDVNF